MKESDVMTQAMAVRERPILFSVPMVRAILAGTKTQTRRVVKGLGVYVDTEMGMGPPELQPDGEWIWPDGTTTRCPYGAPGDRLWVREKFTPIGPSRPSGYWTNPALKGKDYFYAADNDRPTWGGKWRASIHMPRAASRLTLEITGVRVERVQDISDGDARAEGCDAAWAVKEKVPDGRDGFGHLWRCINGVESWRSNPWVWVVSFKRAECAA